MKETSLSPEYAIISGKKYHIKQLYYPVLQDLFLADNLEGLFKSKHKAIKLANFYYKVAKKVRTQKHVCPVGKNCVKGKSTKHRSSADSYYAIYNNMVKKLNQLVVELEFEIKCKLYEKQI